MGTDAVASALHTALTREYLPVSASASTDDEAALVDAAVSGDTAAFASLYDRHVGRVYRQCYYCSGNRSDAEDLTQQTFLQAWQALPRYRRTGAPFLAWLLTISHHLAVSRQRQSRAQTVPDVEMPTSAPGDDPEAAALNRLDRDAVRLAIGRLKPDRQHVILLRFIEGYAVEEIAAATGKTANYVRVLQHRALGDLRLLLEQGSR